MNDHFQNWCTLKLCDLAEHKHTVEIMALFEASKYRFLMQKAVKKIIRNNAFFLKDVKNSTLILYSLCSCFYKSYKQLKKFSNVGFKAKLQPTECTQIANSDQDLLWDIANNSINYCLKKLKKLPDVVKITNERSSEFKKYPLKSSLSKNSRKPLDFLLLRQVPP